VQVLHRPVFAAPVKIGADGIRDKTLSQCRYCLRKGKRTPAMPDIEYNSSFLRFKYKWLYLSVFIYNGFPVGSAGGKTMRKDITRSEMLHKQLLNRLRGIVFSKIDHNRKSDDLSSFHCPVYRYPVAAFVMCYFDANDIVLVQL